MRKVMGFGSPLPSCSGGDGGVGDVRIDAGDPLAVAATTAVQTGDLDALRSLLAEHPHLARARIGDTNTSRGLLHVDIAPPELAEYCIHALNAAAHLPTKAAARRLIDVTLAGLRPPA